MEKVLDDMIEFVQTRFSFIFRLLTGLAGFSILLSGLRRRDTLGVFFCAFGMGALVRALTNIETAQLFSLLLHPTIRLARTITVNAPVEVVYDFWKDFSNYSKFMSFIDNVRINEHYGFTWTVESPAGVPVHWDSIVKALVPNQLISWESAPNALVENTGKVIFKTTDDENKTQIEVYLTFNPPAGLLGYQVVKLIGFDPRSRFVHDLAVMKSLIENKYHQEFIEETA